MNVDYKLAIEDLLLKSGKINISVPVTGGLIGAAQGVANIP